MAKKKGKSKKGGGGGSRKNDGGPKEDMTPSQRTDVEEKTEEGKEDCWTIHRVLHVFE
jgi:hypothetical protein